MNEKVSIKKIKTDISISKVSFCHDGHTIAVGSDSEDGIILIYDLRKSASEVFRYCVGNSGPIMSLNFGNKAVEMIRKEEIKYEVNEF